MSLMGWECPRCHSTFAPWIGYCLYCAPTDEVVSLPKDPPAAQDPDATYPGRTYPGRFETTTSLGSDDKA